MSPQAKSGVHYKGTHLHMHEYMGELHKYILFVVSHSLSLKS